MYIYKLFNLLIWYNKIDIQNEMRLYLFFILQKYSYYSNLYWNNSIDISFSWIFTYIIIKVFIIKYNIYK